ncbi:hypothetical protein [Caballeronia sordidicola]|uniref:Mobile element protein n=1 Tax=Caballeronia sordidicola TaxID=196367 RepID=A0A226X8K4_CABSO|nr:hypothetical protein [Caballeronia sordidicola]OXC79791.1 Mobile element protein [Caballeronia sordidicola]
MNVLKPHLQSTVFTLLERNKSQRQIQRLTGIDRKTIRRYQAIFESEKSGSANSSIVVSGGANPALNGGTRLSRSVNE